MSVECKYSTTMLAALPTPNPPTAESVTQTSINLTYDNVEGATMYNILVEDPSGNVVTVRNETNLDGENIT